MMNATYTHPACSTDQTPLRSEAPLGLVHV